MKQKHRILAAVFAALLAASACSMSVFAASSTPAESCPIVVQVDEPAVSLTTEEETVLFANTDFNLTENPAYLGVVTRGSSQPGDVWTISEKGSYFLNGELKGKKSVYTDYLFTGQYSYTVTISCSSNSGTAISCVGYNASSNNKYINGITVGPGESKTMKLTGLSKTSKVFLKFTGLNDASTMTRISGTVS